MKKVQPLKGKGSVLIFQSDSQNFMIKHLFLSELTVRKERLHWWEMLSLYCLFSNFHSIYQGTKKSSQATGCPNKSTLVWKIAKIRLLISFIIKFSFRSLFSMIQYYFKGSETFIFITERVWSSKLKNLIVSYTL